MKLSLIFIITFWSILFGNSVIDNSTTIISENNQQKIEGIATYTFLPYGIKKPFEKYLRFDKNGAWYAHQQEKETITEENYKHYYYNEKQDWYYQNDSVYYFNDGEHYPVYFSRWANKEIEWEITNETQTIAGFLAIKAVTKGFHDNHPLNSGTPRGKTIAWFTTEIPLSYGIDGYEGLPGLIVKLEYENREDTEITTLKSIEYKEVEDWQIPSTDKKIEVSRYDAYNPWKLGKKWFKKQAKKLKIK
jgi:GLPGLI family protein